MVAEAAWRKSAAAGAGAASGCMGADGTNDGACGFGVKSGVRRGGTTGLGPRFILFARVFRSAGERDLEWSLERSLRLSLSPCLDLDLDLERDRRRREERDCC